MPPMLKSFKGAAGSVQTKEMYYENLSCLFDARRVDHHKKANKEFAGYFKLKAPEKTQALEEALCKKSDLMQTEPELEEENDNLRAPETQLKQHFHEIQEINEFLIAQRYALQALNRPRIEGMVSHDDGNPSEWMQRMVHDDGGNPAVPEHLAVGS